MWFMIFMRIENTKVLYERYESFLNNVWVFMILTFRFHSTPWNRALDFDGIEEQQRDWGKDRNRGLPAMALIVDEFTSFLRRFVIRLNCVYGMEFMSCDSSFDLSFLFFLSFFFFGVIIVLVLFKRVTLIDTAF